MPTERAMTAAERQRASRAARRQAGGRQVTVMLGPDAAAALERWEAAGHGAAETLNALLRASRPGRALPKA